MTFKVGDRVTLTCDVPIRMISRDLRLRKGENGTVIIAGTADILTFYIVRFDSCGWEVVIEANQMVHAVDELASLRAQLAARDAALDAVLQWASETDSAYPLLHLLFKHGVHPK
jgi:hypothetical protein